METEKQVENRLKLEIEKLGGKAYKFVSPGISGVPDRLILLPGGIAKFVELKKPGEEPRPLQKKRAKEIKALGFEVHCLDSTDAVISFARSLIT